MRGVITKVFYGKGFGFLRGEDGVSRFFHATSVIPERDFDVVAIDDQVTFVPDSNGPGGNKERAFDVRKHK